MARKKALSHVPRILDEKSSDHVKSPEHVKELDLKDLLETEQEAENDSEKPIKTIYLAPAGYPIKPFDAPENLQVIVRDEKLFQSYASEQWLGLSVQLEDYMFDQLIIPDYAFKVIKIIPKDATRISAETQFILQQEKMAKPKIRAVHFDEIVGNLQAIDKAKVIVEFLKEPGKFGRWAPKNILFYGPPGTGKTLTAKAIATESNCSFLARKGTMLIGLHVGDGASKIHQLFAEAKQHAPAIIFIDELDSIGLNRSYQSVRGDVIEVATALLSEMDGLEENESVITIAATNSIDLLDPGLRSRFEEEIEFPLPNEKERVDLLKLFSKDFPVPIEIDFTMIANRTDKWAGRDIHEKLMKVALHRAIQQKLPKITTELLNKIIDNVNAQQNLSRPPAGFFT